MASASASLPSTASVLVRLALCLVTTLAFQLCMRRPNPDPPRSERKRGSRLEFTRVFFEPAAWMFTTLPAVMELAAVVRRFWLPLGHGTAPGTCTEHLAPNAVALVGCLLALVGLAIRLWCYHALGPLFTFELAVLPKHKLVTHGPYAYVRHPSYMGGQLAMTGVSIVNSCAGAWAHECRAIWWGLGWWLTFMLATAVMIKRCRLEDNILREAFAKEWDAWRTRVRWRMIPGVF